VPWLTRDSILLLQNLIRETDTGLEFGSGRSTKWFAKRCKFIYSVEHDKEWFDIVNKMLSGIGNVDYNYSTINYLDPLNSEYLDILQKIKPESIDFILNDGKIRGHVALASLPKLKSGGIYIIDNAERYISNNLELPESIGSDLSKMAPQWIDFLEITKTWRRIWTVDGITSTLLLFKP
jgi:predicted O-methyltransferase YrrM